LGRLDERGRPAAAALLRHPARLGALPRAGDARRLSIRRHSLVTAIAGVILSGYLYFSQFYTFRVASPQEAVNLLLFMIVAVVVSHLANQAKRHTTIARKREQEMSDLYAFSRRLAAAPSAAEIFVAIQSHLAHLVQRKVVLLGAAGDAGAAGRVPERVRAEVARAEVGDGAERTIDDGEGNVWLIRRVSPKTPDFGSVAVDLARRPPGDARSRFQPADRARRPDAGRAGTGADPR
jgi:two-component system, OmpR family, sensor histidine kinase KdpD